MRVETREEFFGRLHDFEINLMIESENRWGMFSTVFVTVKIPADDFVECISYANAHHYYSYGSYDNMIVTAGFPNENDAMRFRLRWG